MDGRQYKDEVFGHFARIGAAFGHAKRVEIVEELGDPLCDPQQIARKTEELNQLENQLNRDFIAALLKINDILEPGQRLSMIYGLSRNWFFFNPRPESGGPHE